MVIDDILSKYENNRHGLRYRAIRGSHHILRDTPALLRE
jgi:hypothetical protein